MKRSDLPTFSALRIGDEFFVPPQNDKISPKGPKDGPFVKMTPTMYINAPTALNPGGGISHRATGGLTVWPSGTSRDVDAIMKKREGRTLDIVTKSDGQKLGERRYRDAKKRLRGKLGREPTTYEMARNVAKRMAARKPSRD